MGRPSCMQRNECRLAERRRPVTDFGIAISGNRGAGRRSAGRKIDREPVYHLIVADYSCSSLPRHRQNEGVGEHYAAFGTKDIGPLFHWRLINSLIKPPSIRAARSPCPAPLLSLHPSDGSSDGKRYLLCLPSLHLPAPPPPPPPSSHPFRPTSSKPDCLVRRRVAIADPIQAAVISPPIIRARVWGIVDRFEKNIFEYLFKLHSNSILILSASFNR